MENIKVAVIGLGNIGSAHTNCIANGEIKGFELAAVCDINPKKLEEFKFLNVKQFLDYKELFSENIVKAVIIAVPHPLHAAIAIEAFKHGLHVLLEKPADITVSKVERIYKAHKKAGTVFSMMFNQRTNPVFIKAREIVKSGTLGELKRSVWIINNWFRTEFYYKSGDWRATWRGEGGGVLINQAPHNLDLWQWICGMPSTVTAFCEIAKHHDIEVEDEATIITTYKNGASGVFITSTGEYPGTNRLEVSGDYGKMVLENGKLKLWKLKESLLKVTKTSSESFAEIDYDYSEFEGKPEGTGHKEIIQNFANAILNGEQLIAPGTDGIFELTISNAAYLSSWKNNTPVSIPFDNEEFDSYLNNLKKTSKYKQKSISEKASNSYKNRWNVNW